MSFCAYHQEHLQSWSRYLSLHEPGTPALMRAMQHKGFHCWNDYPLYMVIHSVIMLYGKDSGVALTDCHVPAGPEETDTRNNLRLLLSCMRHATIQRSTIADVSNFPENEQWVPAHDVSPNWLILQFLQE